MNLFKRYFASQKYIKELERLIAEKDMQIKVLDDERLAVHVEWGKTIDRQIETEKKLQAMIINQVEEDKKHPGLSGGE